MGESVDVEVEQELEACAAGGASGVFSTAQQLGGALGVAMSGTVFFDQLEGHSFTDAFQHTTPVVIGLFVAAAGLACVLPQTVSDEDTF